ncbi:2331_t:CDS:1 [Scutellospora calospora]|uniref:2331_t:CDS:1 n=1 Tax=Scutellospora calospora TaxID=85575 RepID=A0ACA9KL08_9GLOM|nr:2331_t:CDS:1 [Scutellospora calospora]
MSDPVGKDEKDRRRVYKENYLYLYKSLIWKVESDYLIRNNKIERSSYIVRFKYLIYDNLYINLVSYHMRLNKSYIYNEIVSLVTDVYPKVKRNVMNKTNNKNMGILDGFIDMFKKISLTNNSNTKLIVLIDNFNAAGNYITKANLNRLDKLLTENEMQ